MEPIYMLWLREVKRYTTIEAADPRVAGAATACICSRSASASARLSKGERRHRTCNSFRQESSAWPCCFRRCSPGIALMWDRQFGFLKETLVAPVPRLEIMIGRTLGSATTSMIQGLLVSVVCLIAGFRPISLAAVPGRVVLPAADRDSVRRTRHHDRLASFPTCRHFRSS